MLTVIFRPDFDLCQFMTTVGGICPGSFTDAQPWLCLHMHCAVTRTCN